jgi:formyltetrahydrofolate deformylase
VYTYTPSKRQCRLIGALAYAVTEILDEGPIIRQVMERISHRDAHKTLVAIGRDIEEGVRSRAERWHIEIRLLVYKDKTAMFE